MNARIRVLEVTASLAPAGAERIVVSLASALDRDSFEVGVASLFDASLHSLDPELERNHIPVWHLGKRPGPDPRIYFRLKRLVDSFQPAIIHTHCYVTRYTFPLSVPVKIHTVHNLASLETDWIGQAINARMFRHGVVPVAVGAAVAASVSELYSIPRPVSIRNGIDTRSFRNGKRRALWRKENGFHDEDVLVVSVGRLDPQKDPEALVSAIQEIPALQLLLVGDGKLRSRLERHPRVHLLGLREDIPSILAASDLFALASVWEGLPLALVEAMAAGLPIVATSVGCVPEVVQHGVTGLLVKPSNRAEMIAALRYLLDHRVERLLMGEAARFHAESFSLSSMVRGYENLFFDLVNYAPVYSA